MKVLGIETSCDETSVAVVEDGVKVLSNIIASSIDLHKKYGGIVPEIATRHHAEIILHLLKEALSIAGVSLKDINLIAVTQGPGLIGSLMVGMAFAKSLSQALKIPILGVDHILAHIYSCYLSYNKPQFPYLGLVVSGGHSSILYMKDFNNFIPLAKTRDDALGECFDKVAKILGLEFPGGPVIEKKALNAKEKNISFPTPWIKNSYDFSYSGLKTAVLYYVKKIKTLDEESISEICYAFQEAALAAILKQVKKVILDYKINRLLVGGGVSANSRLRELLKTFDLELFLPEISYCSDNAGMVAGLGYELYNRSMRSDFSLEPYSIFENNLKMNR